MLQEILPSEPNCQHNHKSPFFSEPKKAHKSLFFKPKKKKNSEDRQSQFEVHFHLNLKISRDERTTKT